MARSRLILIVATVVLVAATGVMWAIYAAQQAEYNRLMHDDKQIMKEREVLDDGPGS
jgi:hypothetical protein